MEQLIYHGFYMNTPLRHKRSGLERGQKSGKCPQTRTKGHMVPIAGFNVGKQDLKERHKESNE